MALVKITGKDAETIRSLEQQYSTATDLSNFDYDWNYGDSTKRWATKFYEFYGTNAVFYDSQTNEFFVMKEDSVAFIKAKCLPVTPPVKVLPKKWNALINKVAKTVGDGDLYTALHHVGHDDAKSEIEDVLKRSLDTDTFNRVVAIFKIATDDSLTP